jgi:hypothetical protein
MGWPSASALVTRGKWLQSARARGVLPGTLDEPCGRVLVAGAATAAEVRAGHEAALAAAGNDLERQAITACRSPPPCWPANGLPATPDPACKSSIHLATKHRVAG